MVLCWSMESGLHKRQMEEDEENVETWMLRCFGENMGGHGAELAERWV